MLGPSYRRRKGSGSLPAIERYDGLFYRVARKYLGDVRDVDVLVMKDDLTLVDAKTPLSYIRPEGEKWGGQSLSEETVERARKRNETILSKKLKDGRYLEVFIAMGKKYAEALPDLSQYNVKILFPISGGPGPKALALKNWMSGGE